MKIQLIATLSISLTSTSHAFLMWDNPANEDWRNPELLEAQIGSNLIDNSLSGGGFCPLFYTLRVPQGLEISALHVLVYDDGNSPRNAGSPLALQTGTTLSHSPFEIKNDTRILINNTIFSDATIGLTDTLERLNDNEELQGAPTLVAGDYALFINETGPRIENFVLDFVATPVPEPSTLSLLLAFPLFLLRRRSS